MCRHDENVICRSLLFKNLPVFANVTVKDDWVTCTTEQLIKSIKKDCMDGLKDSSITGRVQHSPKYKELTASPRGELCDHLESDQNQRRSVWHYSVSLSPDMIIRSCCRLLSFLFHIFIFLSFPLNCVFISTERKQLTNVHETLALSQRTQKHKQDLIKMNRIIQTSL